MLIQTTPRPDLINPQVGSAWRFMLRRARTELGYMWDRSVIKSVVPARFVKFAIVGAVGVVVNLMSFALVVWFPGWADWRASVIGTLAAIGHNYVLNNIWTFRDRMKTGVNLIHGYLFFLSVSGVGLVITTTVYMLLTSSYLVFAPIEWQRTGTPAVVHMGCQLIGIGCATLLNFFLNSKFTWVDSRALATQD